MVFEVTLERMIIFFLILAIGFTAAKAGVIKQESMPAFAQLITKILLPVMIFYSTYANCTRQDIFDNIVLIGLSAIFYAVISLLMFILAQLLRLPHDKDRIFQFCFIFGNTGFVGIPLLASVFPQGGLVYMMMFSIVDQLVFWTYGIWLSTGRLPGHKHRFNFRMLLTPNVIAIFVAIIFVLLQIPIPDLLKMTLGTVSNATSAMCMIYLGVLVCFSNVLPVLKRPETYVGIGVKMLLLPILAGRLLSWTPLPSDMISALVIIMALPTMTVVPMLAAQNSNEGEYAAGMTVVTLVASVATIPLAVFLA